MSDKKKMGGTKESYIAKVKEGIGTMLDVIDDQIKDEALLVGDLGADDLALVELVIWFEEQFEFDIPDGVIFIQGESSTDTVKSVIDYMLSRVEFEE